MHRIFIDGKEGTTGLRIYERIKARTDCTLLLLPDEERKDINKRAEMIRASDITFLCLPDAAAREAAAAAKGSAARIIDASTAHRIAPDFVYGFPELGRYGAIREANRVATPGCHASGFLALTYPLLQEGILSKDALLSCFSVTGYSGGGKSVIAQYRDTARAPEYASPRHYALAQQHKHLKEMTHVSGLSHAPVFNPVIADFYAGMLVTIPLHAKMLKKATSLSVLHALYAAYYVDRPVIRVLPYKDGNDTLAANWLADNDGMEILVTGNEERFCLMARYDNLGKGASGAAVQCMNIMLGLDETNSLALK